MAHNNIYLNMVMISITVYIQEKWILNYYQHHTGIGKRIIDTIAKHQSNICFGGHVTYTDWYVHTCQHMNM